MNFLSDLNLKSYINWTLKNFVTWVSPCLCLWRHWRQIASAVFQFGSWRVGPWLPSWCPRVLIETCRRGQEFRLADGKVPFLVLLAALEAFFEFLVVYQTRMAVLTEVNVVSFLLPRGKTQTYSYAGSAHCWCVQFHSLVPSNWLGAWYRLSALFLRFLFLSDLSQPRWFCVPRELRRSRLNQSLWNRISKFKINVPPFCEDARPFQRSLAFRAYQTQTWPKKFEINTVCLLFWTLITWLIL